MYALYLSFLKISIEEVISKCTDHIILILFSLFTLCFVLALNCFIRNKKSIPPPPKIFKRKDEIFLITGPTASGKTSLFYLLSEGKKSDIITVSSLSPNQMKILDISNTYNSAFEKVKVENGNLLVIDLPGPLPLMTQLSQYTKKAKYILFIIDAFDKAKFHDAARQIFKIIMDEDLISRKVPLLICFNKTDKYREFLENSLKSELLKEMENIRRSRFLISKADSIELTHLGTPDQLFDFDKAHIPIKFCFISVLQNQINDILDFFSNVDSH